MHGLQISSSALLMRGFLCFEEAPCNPVCIFASVVCAFLPRFLRRIHLWAQALLVSRVFIVIFLWGSGAILQLLVPSWPNMSKTRTIWEMSSLLEKHSTLSRGENKETSAPSAQALTCTLIFPCASCMKPLVVRNFLSRSHFIIWGFLYFISTFPHSLMSHPRRCNLIFWTSWPLILTLDSEKEKQCFWRKEAAENAKHSSYRESLYSTEKNASLVVHTR